MCLMSVYPPGVQPDVARLTEGALVNADGHGGAVTTPRGVAVYRGLDAGDVLGEFAEARERYPDGPAVFHSRWASSGDAGLANCQPFIIAEDSLGLGSILFAHNGTLPDLPIAAGDDRSDSRVIAEDYLPQMLADGPAGLERLEALLGDTVAVLLRGQEFAMFGGTVGMWRDGGWYSSSDWLPAPMRGKPAPEGLPNIEARRLYRTLGDQVLRLWGDGKITEASTLNAQRRGLIEAYPYLHTGGA